MSEEARVTLPRFQEALKAHAKSLTTGTYWRYVNGLLPAFGQFVVQRPDLARALAEDAVALAQQSGDRAIVTQERG